jgi:threonine dehydrogenase-like Zn-dependent dehydrogenase
MQAIVFHGVGDIRLDEMPEPRIEQPTDAVVRLTASAICGTDLHMVRGTMPGMKPGTVLGHEGVGVVAEVGPEVRNLRAGDRVVIPSTICCGTCVYCRAGYSAQCDEANPNGSDAGTAFYGGPASTGPFHGLQAERARIPFAAANLVRRPDEVDDDQAIILSDIFPTGWFGAELAEIEPGDTVFVFGCGPVGQFAIASALLMDAGRVFAVDTVPARLDAARSQGAETIDFEQEDPVEILKELTNGIGPDRVIDAVGIDALRPHHGPAARQAKQQQDEFRSELEKAAPEACQTGEHWRAGDGPSQVLRWAVQGVAKAGTVSIIGVYPPSAGSFPIGEAMNRNLTLKMGNCNHRRYIPHLLRLVRGGILDPSRVITQHEPLASAIEAFEAFDQRASGWIKVKLSPPAQQSRR